MKVLLVVPTHNYTGIYPTFLSFSDFPTGYGYIAAALKQAGHQVIGLNLNNDSSFHSAYEMVSVRIQKALQDKPDLIGIGGICTDYKFIKDAMSVIREIDSTIPIVLGGGIVTNDAEYIFNLLKPDYAIVGEAEEEMVKLANGRLHRNDEMAVRILPAFKGLPLPKLDSLPFPDYEPFGVQDILDNYSMSTRLLYRYSRPYPRPFTLVASRSCPFSCLPSSEMVELANGSQKEISEIVDGDTVQSVDVNGNSSISRVSTTRRAGVRHDIIELTLMKGSIRCTSDHKILTHDGWTAAGSLAVGDSVGTYVRRSEGTKPTADVGEQPHAFCRDESEGQCECEETTRCVEQTYERELGTRENSSSQSDRYGKETYQRQDENPESYAQPSIQNEGYHNTPVAQLLRPESVSRKMVPETHWPQPSRSSNREGFNSNGVPFCGGWEVLDRPVPEWEMSQSRLHLQERAKQDSHSVQFHILAPTGELRRQRINDRLSKNGMAYLCDNRTDAGGYGISQSESVSVVEWIEIIAITRCPPESVYDIETVPYHNFIASGVIVHNCTFCTHGGDRPKYRARSIENIMQEIKVSYERYKFNILILVDELFAVSKERMRTFCEAVLKGKETYGWDFDWMFQTHANAKLDRETLELAKQAGCYFFSYGIESTSPTVLKSMHKHSNVPQIIQAIKLAHEAKLGFGGNLIFGDPAETPETMIESFDFYLRYCKAAMVFPGFLMPYPGSKLFDECIQRGIITDKKEYYETIERRYNMTHMEMPEWVSWGDFITKMAIIWWGVETCEVIKVEVDPEVNPLTEQWKLPVYKIWARCPYCKEAIFYRNILPPTKTQLGVGCTNCGKKIKINIGVRDGVGLTNRSITVSIRTKG